MNRSVKYISSLLIAVVAACSGPPLTPLLSDESLTNQSAITININGYCPQPGNRFTDIFALNRTAQVLDGSLTVDFDGDGVPNILDSNSVLGINPYLADSNNDGYSDLIVYLLGIPLSTQGALPECDQTGRQDDDNDGLDNCEEALLGTSSGNADTDGDGIPDYLEVRYSLDPLDAMDAKLNPSGDGISNYQKVKMNIPIHEYATSAIMAFAYQYSISQVGSGPSSCYNFSISNVPLAQIPNGNQFVFYVLEQATVPATAAVPTTISTAAQVSVASTTPGGSQLNYSFQDIRN
jgi:hypothetical protein